jgi:DNA-binding Xre family transcriptional regulator
MNSLKKKDWKLPKRLRRLPADQIPIVKSEVMRIAGVTDQTYLRVLRQFSFNFDVLLALAEVLNCKIDDVMNPDYQFQDPNIVLAQENTSSHEG